VKIVNATCKLGADPASKVRKGSIGNTW